MTGVAGQGDSDRSELARSLRALRSTAGLKQTELAERSGLDQTRISRAERDRRLLDPGAVAQFADGCRATSAERARLIRLAEAAAREHIDSRVILQRGGAHHFQERIRRYEEDCELVRGYQPGMILGQLQTDDYASAVFGARQERDPEEVADLVASRRRRHAQVSEPGRRWRLIQTEGALDWCLRGPELMAIQMRRLVEVSALPNVELGVIAARTPATVVAAHGFHIYDSAAVQVGTKTGTALLSTAEDVDTYASLFERLAELAVFGDEAREVLERTAAEYRSRSQ